MSNTREIKQQCKFCAELMLRLNANIQGAGEYHVIHGADKGLTMYTQKQEDVRRLRRELMTLQKMLCPW